MKLLINWKRKSKISDATEGRSRTNLQADVTSERSTEKSDKPEDCLSCEAASSAGPLFDRRAFDEVTRRSNPEDETYPRGGMF
jgi:hypothetical protein